MQHPEPEPPRKLLLSAADMEERRLLLAELLEAGCDVLAVPGLFYATGALLVRLVAPIVVLVDLQGDSHATPEHVEELLALVPNTPVMLVVGAMEIGTWEPLHPRLGALLRRPISVGEVVETVRRVLERD